MIKHRHKSTINSYSFWGEMWPSYKHADGLSVEHLDTCLVHLHQVCIRQSWHVLIDSLVLRVCVMSVRTAGACERVYVTECRKRRFSRESAVRLALGETGVRVCVSVRAQLGWGWTPGFSSFFVIALFEHVLVHKCISAVLSQHSAGVLRFDDAP